MTARVRRAPLVPGFTPPRPLEAPLLLAINAIHRYATCSAVALGLTMPGMISRFETYVHLILRYVPFSPYLKLEEISAFETRTRPSIGLIHDSTSWSCTERVIPEHPSVAKDPLVHFHWAKTVHMTCEHVCQERIVIQALTRVNTRSHHVWILARGSGCCRSEDAQRARHRGKSIRFAFRMRRTDMFSWSLYG